MVYTFFETMDELRSVLTVEEVASFEKEWEKLDPDGTGYIGVWKLSALMERCKISTIKYHIIFFPLVMKMRFVESHIPIFEIGTPLFTESVQREQTLIYIYIYIYIYIKFCFSNHILITVRFAMHPLWFDGEKYPDKHDLFTAMLQDEMEIIRAGETQLKE